METQKFLAKQFSEALRVMKNPKWTFSLSLKKKNCK